MKNNILKIVIIGNIFEYYDFTIYAVFSSVIGSLFFPAYDYFSQILLSLAVFSIGFFMRPLGGVVFGHIGDKYGRKTSITFSIFGMAIATLLIGLLPSYEVIGVYAPFCLVALRLFQGLCMGGEGTGVAIFILEHLQEHKPGFVGGIITASGIIGSLIATMIGILFSFLFIPPNLAWRIAFMLGGLLGFVGFYLRFKSSETPIFKYLEQTKNTISFPLLSALTSNWKEMIVVGCLGGIIGAISYFILSYINIFFTSIASNSTLALAYTAWTTTIYIIFLLLIGKISDRFGYKLIIIITCFAIMFFSVPLFFLLASEKWFFILPSLSLFGILAAGVCAPSYPFMMSLFLPQQRYSGIALSFNIGIALFGGTTPMISAFLAQETGLFYAPAFYLTAISLLFIFSTLNFQQKL